VHWFYDPTFTAESRSVRAEEAQHLKSLRIRPDEKLVVTDGKGGVFHCQADGSAPGSVSVLSFEKVEPSGMRIQLIQAIAKGDRDELALQASVELGINSVIAWQADHSISRWDGKEEKSLERWRQIAISAMKQSQQAYLPEVSGPMHTTNLEPVGHGVLLVPQAERSITEIDLEADQYAVVVGPEGGISSSEVEQLVAAGFHTYRLGASVLRTSTAGPAAIAAIKSLRGLW